MIVCHNYIFADIIPIEQTRRHGGLPKALTGTVRLMHTGGEFPIILVVYAKYSIYDQLYMYDDRVHLENNPLSHFTDVPERISCFCCV